jgi:YbbR domain-containing protein
MSAVRKYLLSEIRLKLLSLLLAVMLWSSMMYTVESHMTFSAPISFDKLQKGLMIREADTRDILITVNGSLSVLKNIRAKDIAVALDVSRIKEGRHIVNITRSDIIVPKGVKIEDVKPEYVVVETDKIVEKHLRTVVKLGDKLADVYQLVSWYPQYVYVEGPKELLEKTHSIATFPVDGNFSNQQEILDIPLDTRSLEPRRVRPETARVILKRIIK